MDTHSTSAILGQIFALGLKGYYTVKAGMGKQAFSQEAEAKKKMIASDSLRNTGFPQKYFKILQIFSNQEQLQTRSTPKISRGI